MARKAFAVNDAVREKVRHLAGIGLRQDDIAKIIGCSPKTLRKRLRYDLDRGVAEANATVFGYLFASAKAGNVTAQIFWLRVSSHNAPGLVIWGVVRRKKAAVKFATPPDVAQRLKD
jgi:hypothetical protein